MNLEEDFASWEELAPLGPSYLKESVKGPTWSLLAQFNLFVASNLTLSLYPSRTLQHYCLPIKKACHHYLVFHMIPIVVQIFAIVLESLSIKFLSFFLMK